MKTKIKTLALILAVSSMTLAAGCTTPQRVMLNTKTGATVICGNNLSSSLAGGVIGYHIQKAQDQKCVDALKAEGFKEKGVSK